MPTYNEFFGHCKKILLPVIHAKDRGQVLRNAQRAFESGADGIFLINHEITAKELLKIYEEARGFYQKHFIGLNLLGTTTSDALHMTPESASGLWVDSAGYKEGAFDPTHDASWYAGLHKDLFPGLYFGSVAFKYQPEVTDPAKAARLMKPLLDVMVTSGPQTGVPPHLEKLKAMRGAIGDGKLFAASGATCENIGTLLPYIDGILVATGISSPNDKDELEASLIRVMRRRMDLILA